MNLSSPLSARHHHLLLGVALLLVSPAPALAQNKAAEPARDKSSQATPPPARPEPPGRQELPARRLDRIADPFEVSPQLRENRKSGSSFGALPSSSRLELQRQIQLRAVLITPRGRAAQLGIRQKDSITVMDGELVDLGDLGTFHVKIDPEGVALSNPSRPQDGKINLR